MPQAVTLPCQGEPSCGPKFKVSVTLPALSIYACSLYSRWAVGVVLCAHGSGPIRLHSLSRLALARTSGQGLQRQHHNSSSSSTAQFREQSGSGIAAEAVAVPLELSTECREGWWLHAGQTGPRIVLSLQAQRSYTAQHGKQALQHSRANSRG